MNLHVYSCLVFALHEEWWDFACLDWCVGLLEDEVLQIDLEKGRWSLKRRENKIKCSDILVVGGCKICVVWISGWLLVFLLLR